MSTGHSPVDAWNPFDQRRERLAAAAAKSAETAQEAEEWKDLFASKARGAPAPIARGSAGQASSSSGPDLFRPTIETLRTRRRDISQFRAKTPEPDSDIDGDSQADQERINPDGKHLQREPLSSESEEDGLESHQHELRRQHLLDSGKALGEEEVPQLEVPPINVDDA